MVVCISAGEFMALGLELAGYKQWRSYKEKENIKRFKAHYGALPQSCENIWVDLQTTTDEECRIESDESPRLLLLGLRFLWVYPTEKQLCTTFEMSEKTVRKWSGVFTKKLQLLLPNKMGSWDEVDEGLIFMLSIDGTHCPVEEPRPWSSKWSSHKLGGSAGLNYEIGLKINAPKLVWVYGPTPPGLHPDISVFRQHLKNKIPVGKKVIGDEGYRGEPDFISTKNEFDPREIAEFKERVLARHESFNQRLKNFDCLTTKFRHGIKNHKSAFEAVCAIIMYEIECGGTSLFDPYP